MNIFNLNDIVIISGNGNGHDFPMNERVRITELLSHYCICQYEDGRDWWAVNYDDIEHIEADEPHSDKPYWSRNPLVQSKDGQMTIRVTSNVGKRGVDFFSGVVVEDLIGQYPIGILSDQWCKEYFVLASNKKWI